MAKDEKKQDDGGAGKLTLGGKTLSLKGNVGAQVRQNITQGARGGNVAVEVRRKRAPDAPQNEQQPQEDSNLSSDERDARARALKAALSGGERKSSLPQRRITIEDKKKEFNEQYEKYDKVKFKSS